MNEAVNWFFTELAGKSIENAFSTFLERNINISRGIRSTASISHNRLRDFIADENGRDWTFPAVLSILDRDYLGGSFARHTKVWPLDDIDIYIPLDGCGLVYREWGIVQPVTVATDKGLLWNPLLGERWTKGEYISSDKLVSGFAKVW
ncbi:MAG: hypothetical protein ABSC19_16405 [Syntrophorhabdales bacterium]|jgi:hypothetical protein